MIRSYRDLIVWQDGMKLAETVYVLTRKLPGEELYSLTNQLRRAVVSIPSNISEGYNRNSTQEYINFLSIARGSTAEVETQLLLCERLKYLEPTDMVSALEIASGINKMLGAMIVKLKEKRAESKARRA